MTVIKILLICCGVLATLSVALELIDLKELIKDGVIVYNEIENIVLLTFVSYFVKDYFKSLTKWIPLVEYLPQIWVNICGTVLGRFMLNRTFIKNYVKLLIFENLKRHLWPIGCGMVFGLLMLKYFVFSSKKNLG